MERKTKDSRPYLERHDGGKSKVRAQGMKILVIGGTRYMGRLVVQKLLERGDEVTVFSRGQTRPPWWDRVAHVLGDRTDPASFRDGLAGMTFDAVLDTQAFRKEDVELASATFEGSVGRYVMVSTGSVYLDDKLDFSTHCPFKESDVDWSDLDYTYPPNEDAYGVGKRHCEKWLQENSALPYTIVRIPAVMGWDDPTERMWWWVQRALDGQGIVLPLEKQASFRTLYSDDAASNFIRAIDAPEAANEVYHIAMGEIATPNRWASLIWRAAGAEPNVTYVPDTVLSRSFEGYAPPLCRPIPNVHDLSKAERDFGFQTTPITSWIQATVDWYRAHPPAEDSEGYGRRSEEIELAGRWAKAYEEFNSQF